MNCNRVVVWSVFLPNSNGKVKKFPDARQHKSSEELESELWIVLCVDRKHSNQGEKSRVSQNYLKNWHVEFLLEEKWIWSVIVVGGFGESWRNVIERFHPQTVGLEQCHYQRNFPEILKVKFSICFFSSWKFLLKITLQLVLNRMCLWACLDSKMRSMIMTSSWKIWYQLFSGKLSFTKTYN